MSIKPELIVGIAIPLVAGALILGVRFIRKKVGKAHVQIDKLQ